MGCPQRTVSKPDGRATLANEFLHFKQIGFLARVSLTTAYYLARRFRTDRLKAGIFEIDAATSLIPLQEADRDQLVMERLWEFAGASDENWNRLLSWIAQEIAKGLELEDFLSESIFAPERELAYTELVEDE